MRWRKGGQGKGEKGKGGEREEEERTGGEKRACALFECNCTNTVS